MGYFSYLHAITFIRVRVVFEALEPIFLPRYKGSAFRGCLGEAMRKLTCRYRGANCEKCKEKYTCAFSQLFNSFVEPGHPHHDKFPKSPHPYIIVPLSDDKTEFGTGDTFGFELTLIGKAIGRLPELSGAFNLMGQLGIGKRRGKFRPIELQTLHPSQGYEALPYFGKSCILSFDQLPSVELKNHLFIQLENPLRIKENGQLLRVAPRFDLLAARLALRLGLLAHFHCGAPWPETESLPGAANVTTGQSNVQLTDWRRYSGTQETTMNFDGLTGTIIYTGTELNNWLPLFIAGSWLHAGSTATFGLGKFSIAAS
jgi:hypothetical protein